MSTPRKPRKTRLEAGIGYVWELDPLDPANQPRSKK